MTRRRAVRLLTAGPVAAGFAGCAKPPRPEVPSVPGIFLRDIPAGSRQMLLVLSPRTGAIDGELWRMERRAEGGGRAVSAAVPVTLGRNGMAWGIGLHRTAAPDRFPVKREGDGCSPAGVFRLPWAFGYDAHGPTRLPWRQCTETLRGVDDPESAFYNRIVDESVPGRDWNSAEVMRRRDDLYRLGVFVDHNPSRIPHGGSCIFLHLHQRQGIPTAGCTAMAGSDLRAILEWLDPAAEPVLVQGTRSLYR